MKKIIRCPCCNNQICILFDDGETTVFFDVEKYAQDQEEIGETNIELGMKGGET